jgi:hypothetical protein
MNFGIEALYKILQSKQDFVKIVMVTAMLYLREYMDFTSILHVS